jgi:hypothetical protein
MADPIRAEQDMVQKGDRPRCAKHPSGRSGNEACPLFEPCPKQQSGFWRQRFKGNNAWWLAAVLLTLVIVNAGCAPISTLGFLLNPFFPDGDEPPCPLTVKDKESKVVFLCAHENDVPSLDFRGADEAVCKQLVTILKERYKENKDKIKIVPVSEVYTYLRQHKDWITQSKQDIARHFDADYLVYVELGPMALYGPGSQRTLYRGNVQYQVTAIDVHAPDGDVKFNQPGSVTTPEEASTDTNDAAFKAKFYNRIAKDLAKYFSLAPSQQRMGDD